MNDDQADALIALMASGSSHVDGLPTPGIAQLHTDLKAVSLPHAQCVQIVSAMVLSQVKGKALPKAGDFLAAIRNEANKGTRRSAASTDPSTWSEGTRRRLAMLHESAVLSGPVGALRRLVQAAGLSESRVRGMLREAAGQHGEKRGASDRNPFRGEGGEWLSVSKPEAMAYFNELLFSAVRASGADPDGIVNDWRRENGVATKGTR